MSHSFWCCSRLDVFKLLCEATISILKITGVPSCSHHPVKSEHTDMLLILLDSVWLTLPRYMITSNIHCKKMTLQKTRVAPHYIITYNDGHCIQRCCFQNVCWKSVLGQCTIDTWHKLHWRMLPWMLPWRMLLNRRFCFVSFHEHLLVFPVFCAVHCRKAWTCWTGLLSGGI